MAFTFTAISSLHRPAQTPDAGTAGHSDHTLTARRISDGVLLHTQHGFETPQILCCDIISPAGGLQGLAAKQQCLLALLCSDAVVVQLDNLQVSSDILCILFEAALQLSKSPNWLSKRIVKLFIATTNTSLLHRNKDFYDFLDHLWSTATDSRTKLCDLFEVCFLGLSEACMIHPARQGHLKDCEDACRYMNIPGGPPVDTVTVSGAIPAARYAEYVSLVFQNIHSDGTVNTEAVQVAVADLVCESLVRQISAAAALQGAADAGITASQELQSLVHECQFGVVPVHKLKRIFQEHIAPQQVEPALKSYDSQVAACFPFIKAASSPAEEVICEAAKTFKAALKRNLQQTAGIISVPQMQLRATFHLGYFCEQLGSTAGAQSPFDNVSQTLEQQLAARSSWRLLTADELKGVMEPWTQQPRRMRASSHRNSIRDYAQAEQAIRTACHILEQTMHQVHSLQVPSAAPAAAPSNPAEQGPLQRWERDLVAEMRAAMCTVLHEAVYGVKCAALQAMASLPSEVREIVWSNMQLLQPRRNDWRFGLLTPPRQPAEMPVYVDRHRGSFLDHFMQVQAALLPGGPAPLAAAPVAGGVAAPWPAVIPGGPAAAPAVAGGVADPWPALLPGGPALAAAGGVAAPWQMPAFPALPGFDAAANAPDDNIPLLHDALLAEDAFAGPGHPLQWAPAPEPDAVAPAAPWALPPPWLAAGPGDAPVLGHAAAPWHAAALAGPGALAAAQEAAGLDPEEEEMLLADMQMAHMPMDWDLEV